MKNMSIALAVAAAMVPTVALAEGNVEMYGIADAYIGIQDDDRAGGDGGIVVDSGGQSQSRLGVKGSEDLGGGMSAIFQFEGALFVDRGTPASLNFQRRSYVGMKGAYGQVTLGRNYTPLFWVLIDNEVSRFAHDVNDANLGQANRTNNGVNYQGRFGGLLVNALFAANEGVGDDTIGVAVRYKTPNWRVGAGYHDEGGQDVLGVGGQMGFGGFKVGLNYLDRGAPAGGGANPDANIGLSLGTKVGAAGDVVVNIKDRNDQTEWSVYYRQNMSKRTNWYVGYGDEDTNGTEFRAGIRYRF